MKIPIFLHPNLSAKGPVMMFATIPIMSIALVIVRGIHDSQIRLKSVAIVELRNDVENESGSHGHLFVSFLLITPKLVKLEF